MRFDILTLFPESFSSYFDASIIKRARDKKIIDIHFYNIRDQATDRYRTVDDKPYGGGVGMLMKIEPLFATIKKVPIVGTRQSAADYILRSGKPQARKSAKKRARVILFSAAGRTFQQSRARAWSHGYDQIIMICGRYEGIDHRVTKLAHEQISIGDYVLTGGELAAMTVVDAVTRLLPGALGKNESSQHESFSTAAYLEHPHYTRPAHFSPDGKQQWSVPSVLLGGNHAKISTWRQKYSRKRKK